MKTIIFMFFMLVAGAVPSAANYIGKTVEEGIRTEHAKLQQEAALFGFKIELVDYVRQLYDAKATTRITLANPKQDDEFVLELKHRISHIPQPFKQVIATVDSEFVITEKAGEVLAPLFKDKAPFTSHALIFFDGHQEGTFQSPAASGELAGADGTTIEWQGLTGNAWQSAQLDNLKLNLDMPKLQLGSADTNRPNAFALHKLKYDANMTKGASGMWGGDSKVDIASFDANITDKQGSHTTINIDGINIHGTQSENNGLANGAGIIKSNRIIFNGFSVTDLTYDVAVENIDIEAIMAMQTAIQEMVNNPSEDADPTQPLLAHLPALYNAHPVLKINELSVNSPMGRFVLKMDISSMGEWNDMILQNPVMLTTMLKTNINASVPRSVVEIAMRQEIQKKIVAQAVANDIELSEEEFEKAVAKSVNQQIDGLIQMGYIKVNEGQLESKLEYNAGQIAINGIDASPLAGAMMQSY